MELQPTHQLRIFKMDRELLVDRDYGPGYSIEGMGRPDRTSSFWYAHLLAMPTLRTLATMPDVDFSLGRIDANQCHDDIKAIGFKCEYDQVLLN